MNGMEMMMQAAMKAAGIDVNKMLVQYTPYFDQALAKIAEIEARQIAIDVKLGAIMRHLGIDPGTIEQDTMDAHESKPVLMIAIGE